MSLISSTSNSFQNYMFEYNKQDDFASKAVGFSNEAAQQNALAKTKIANKGIVDADIKKISDALSSGDIGAAQDNFNTFLSNIDQSKLNTKSTKDMIKLRDALENGNIEDASKAMLEIQKDAKQMYGAYDASKSYSSKHKNIITVNATSESTDSYA